MPPAISFIGPHNVGKTTVVLGVLRELKNRGLRVGVLKSSKAPFTEEKPGSDTERFREAGAEVVGFWGAERLVTWRKAPVKDDFTFWTVLFHHFSEVDLVLVEGLKGLASLPKIEISRKGQSEKPFFARGVPGVIAVMADHEVPGLPCFALTDYRGIVSFILSRLPRRRPRVELLVDDRPVGLTRFAGQALWASVGGFVESLRGVHSPKKIELRLIRRP